MFAAGGGHRTLRRTERIFFGSTRAERSAEDSPFPCSLSEADEYIRAPNHQAQFLVGPFPCSRSEGDDEPRAEPSNCACYWIILLNLIIKSPPWMTPELACNFGMSLGESDNSPAIRSRLIVDFVTPLLARRISDPRRSPSSISNSLSDRS